MHLVLGRLGTRPDTSWSTLTWEGRVATHATASAMSSAVSGSGTPAYTASLGLVAAEAHQRELLGLHHPRRDLRDADGWPRSSSRSVSVITATPCLAAV